MFIEVKVILSGLCYYRNISRQLRVLTKRIVLENELDLQHSFMAYWMSLA
jgi:hypothetical protein